MYKQSSMPIIFKTVILISCLWLTSCVNHTSEPASHSGLICANPQNYKGLVVGDGHCVSLIKQCANAPQTSDWRPGNKVRGRNLPEGTIIATFKNGKYPNKHGYHAAIYIEQTKQGIWVWDQWVGKPVHKRLIRYRSDRAAASNTAQAYRVVKLH